MVDNNKQKVTVEIDTHSEDAVKDTRKVTKAVTDALPDLAQFEKRTNALFKNTQRTAQELMETMRQLQTMGVRNQLGQLTKTTQLYGRGGVEGIVEDSLRSRRSRNRTRGVEKDIVSAEADYAKAVRERTTLIKRAIRDGWIEQPRKGQYSRQELDDITRTLNKRLYEADGSRGPKNQKYLISPNSPEGREFRRQVGDIVQSMGGQYQAAEQKMLNDRIENARKAAEQENRDRDRRRKEVDKQVRKDLATRKAAILSTADPEARRNLINQTVSAAEQRARQQIPNYNVDRSAFDDELRRDREKQESR